MFGIIAFTTLFAFALSARANVDPNTPGPNTIYKVGGKCHIEWFGDKNSTTTWKNMAIELMTGDNYHMVHLTTVATGLDGTHDGTFDHTCPDVDPHSAIYFYQFSAQGADKQWTTRFAIADATGKTTPPAQNIQPVSGAAIPWGVGVLVDASAAVPAPNFDSSAAPSSTLVSSPASTPSMSAPFSSSSQTSVTSVIIKTSGPSTSGPSGFSTISSSPIPTPTPSTNGTSTPQGNGAVVSGRLQLWKAAAALGASAVAFIFLL